MQKILLLLVVSFFVGKNCKAQNLVPNPSFEDFTICPSNVSQLYLANDWTININSADYFNSCAPDSTAIDVPQNGGGFQYAATGNAYAGFYAYVQIFPSAKECLGAELISPLTIGQKYFVSFKVSLYDNFPELTCGTDGVGILFTNKFYGDTNFIGANQLFLNNLATVYSTSIIDDTSDWTIISGSFIADSAYKYFMIGHFFDLSHTSFNCFDSNNTSNRQSYYYIDDDCVSPDSLACDLNPEGIYNLKEAKTSISLYPNPATEQLIIDNGQLIINEIEISDALGRVQSCEFKVQRPSTKIDIHSFPSGIYFIKIYFGDGSMEVRRFVKV